MAMERLIVRIYVDLAFLFYSCSKLSLSDQFTQLDLQILNS